eukprot:scaffold3806_cov94-Isochrysis_galbana.AAC.7
MPRANLAAPKAQAWRLIAVALPYASTTHPRKANPTSTPHGPRPHIQSRITAGIPPPPNDQYTPHFHT